MTPFIWHDAVRRPEFHKYKLQKKVNFQSKRLTASLCKKKVYERKDTLMGGPWACWTGPA
eukprot:1148177-Pelagomonas_calceolata.AAC.4